MGKSIKDKNSDSSNKMNSDQNLHSSNEDGSLNAESENIRDVDAFDNDEERDLDDQVHQPVSNTRTPGMDA